MKPIFQKIKMEDKYYFDKLYKKTKGSLWKGSVHKNYLDILIQRIKKGKILDLGAGEGGDAIYLAKKGFDVTAVDISKFVIDGIKRLAKKESVNVKTEIADLEDYKIEKEYDGIISFATLHFLPKDKIDNIIKDIKEKTNKKGINIIMVFRKGDSSEGKFDMYYFKNKELKEYYKDWNIIEYKEYDDIDKCHGKPHIHKIALIIAEKK